MTHAELNEILELHKKWLNGEDGGKRADLTDASLYEVNLQGVNLQGADLRWTNLRGANLKHANLYQADLSHAFMRKADLTGADLRWANLTCTSMCDTNLSYSVLTGANLHSADLAGANLQSANLNGANLTGVKYDTRTSFMALQCPEEGAFIAYKYVNGFIVKLEVPEDAERSSATTRKCRCSKAKVVGFYDLDRNELDIDEVVNDNYVTTIYRKGEMVYPDKWDADRWNECSNGIHFLMTFHEAKNYPIL